MKPHKGHVYQLKVYLSGSHVQQQQQNALQPICIDKKKGNVLSLPIVFIAIANSFSDAFSEEQNVIYIVYYPISPHLN